MPLSYGLRLVCLCLATFFLTHAALGTALALASRRLTRWLETLGPKLAARIMFSLRMLPGGVALLAVGGLCIPSYLWLEPVNDGERMGWLIVTPALLGAAIVLAALARTVAACLAARRFARVCRQAGTKGHVRGERTPATVMDLPAPVVALVGLWQPRLVISRTVLRALSQEQLAMVVSHEKAHRGSRDNLRRLFLLLAPDVLPGISLFGHLDRAWDRMTEWAADDEAASSDPRRSLTLAAALVRVARLGAAPAPSRLAASLLSGTDLSARIQRLVEPVAARETRTGLAWGLRLALACVFALAVVMPLPATQHYVHRLLEQLAH